ncbi:MULTISPECIES: cupredoxin domain-containing protein [Acidobacteriaceae]|uniref:cupredoxin domain-containing protein n=1 Tax=Acidobacteriaceae TaxID=204434 RepID=UPI00131AC43E|nr:MULTISPECIES: cupredoxin domain-containing protein [Acidobacteriaceae]MDW5264794.1 cupredoxin domain-containing protein [Edaphobacter sp.]
MRFIQSAVIAAALVVLNPMSRFAQQAQVKSTVPVITIHARRYEFSPANIILKQGQQVKLVFVSDDVTHSLAVAGLGLEVRIKKNHSSEVLLTPSKAGNFEGECSIYCGAGHDRMKLGIHVEK